MSSLPDISPEERLSLALHTCARTWRQLVDKRLKHLCISQSGWITIAKIAKSAEPLSQRALAELVGIEGPSMVAMIDRLERDGFVTRVPLSSDRRVKLVRLTDAGLKVYAEVHREGTLVRASLFEGLDPHALGVATEILETMCQRIEAAL